MVLTDMHIGSKQFQAAKFEHCVNRALRNKTHVLCLGDVYDCATLGGKTPQFDEAMTLQEAMTYGRTWFGKLAEAGLLDAIVRGNHGEREYRSVGFQPEEDLAATLHVKSLGFSGVVFYECGDKGKDKTRAVFSVYCHHTAKGGEREGAAINAVADLTKICEGADFYIGGHTHQLDAKPLQRTRISTQGNGNRLVTKQPWLVCCGSFLGWDGSYAEAHQRPQAPCGYATLHLRRKDDDRIGPSADTTPM